MTQDNKPTESKKEESNKPQDNTGVMMTGHIKMSDPETGEVIVDKRNDWAICQDGTAGWPKPNPYYTTSTKSALRG